MLNQNDFFALLTLFIITILARIYHRTWFAPGTFFPLVWFLFILVCRVIAVDYPVFSFGLWTIVACVAAVSVGSVFLPPVYGRDLIENADASQQLVKMRKRVPSLVKILLVLTILAVIGVLIVISFGVSIYHLTFDWSSLGILPAEFATDRYGGSLTLPWYIKILMYFVYPAALLGGISINYLKGVRKILTFIPVVIGIIYGMIFAVRAGILLAIILFFSGFISVKTLERKNLNQLFRGKLGLGAVALILGLVSTYLLIQWLRVGASGYFLYTQFIIQAKAAILGSLSAFSIWIENYPQQFPSLGLKTFAAPLELVGLTVRAGGFYTDFASIGESYTNIYTVFRGLISDFTVPGSLIFCVLIGFWGSVAFNKCYEQKVLWLVPLALFYSFTLFSFLISIFNNNSIIAGFLIVFVSLIFCLRPISSYEEYSDNYS